MQINLPRFCGVVLLNFAHKVGDHLDLKSITIDDRSDGQTEVSQAGAYAPAKMIFEAQDGATFETEIALNAPLNAGLGAKWIAAQLNASRAKAAAEAPPQPETRKFTQVEALKILDRLRNEVGGIKSQFPVGFDPAVDATIHGRILFNDGAAVEVNFPNVGPMTVDGFNNLVDMTKAMRADRGSNTVTGGKPA